MACFSFISSGQIIATSHDLGPQMVVNCKGNPFISGKPQEFGQISSMEYDIETKMFFLISFQSFRGFHKSDQFDLHHWISPTGRVKNVCPKKAHIENGWNDTVNNMRSNSLNVLEKMEKLLIELQQQQFNSSVRLQIDAGSLSVS